MAGDRGAGSGREGSGQCLVVMFLFCCMINFIIYASGGDKRRLGVGFSGSFLAILQDGCN